MRWLHISDVHYNPDKDGRSSDQLRVQLPKYLAALKDPVDEVFVTGDFRFARDQKDSDEVAERSVAFVLDLAESVGVNDSEHIHIVPGNHDLNRYANPNDKRKLSRIINSYLKNSDNGQFPTDDTRFLLDRFSFFKRICSKLYPNGSVWTDSLQPLHAFRCFGDYSLLYLNTAIVCNKNEERGELVIGNDALYRALKEIKAQNGDKPIIVLAHHALDCLTKKEREEVEKLLRYYSVNLYLCGDSHEVWHRQIYKTAEITMGCIKQESGIQAAFSIGELQSNGIITIDAHLWDSRLGGWGPYSQFNQTIKNIFPQPPADTIKPQILKNHTVKLFGRESIIDEIHQKLLLSVGQYAVEVQGPPGIGKTSVCRAVMQHFDPGRATEVDMTRKLTKTDALTALLNSFGIEQPEVMENQVETLLRSRPGQVVYFDNMEDPLVDENYKKWFVDFIDNSGWHILYSSRKRLHNPKIKNILVPQLVMPDAKHMFLSHWGKSADSNTQPLEDLLTALDCHPLSIKLVAAQKYKYPTINALLDAWNKNKDHHDDMKFEDDDGPHSSLNADLKMSYNAVKSNREALVLWAVLSFLPSALSRELFDVTFQHNQKAYEEAVRVLLKNSLIETIILHENGAYGYSMLNPIKSQAFTFNESNRELSVSLLREAFQTIFKAGDHRKHSNHANWHDFSIRCLFPALTLLDRTLLDEGRNCSLILSMRNYYQKSAPMSLELLRNLAAQQNDPYLSAFLNETMGDLENRLGQIDAAQRHYEQAEALFRAEQSNLGLANVLQSMGDLERLHENYLLAIEYYEKALILYNTEQDLMGKSYTMAELCRIYALAGKTDEAMQFINEIIGFFDEMPEYKRPYVVGCIKESMDLLNIDTDVNSSPQQQEI